MADAVQPAHKVYVLLADEEGLMIQTLGTILALGGYEVCAVFSGTAALQLLERLHPHLVITDLLVRDGIDTVPDPHTGELLHMRRCRIFVYAGISNLQMLLQSGDLLTLPFDLLTRPIARADLQARLHASLCSDEPPFVIPLGTEQVPVH